MGKALQRQERPFTLEIPFEEALERFARVNTKDLTDVPALEEPETNRATPF